MRKVELALVVSLVLVQCLLVWFDVRGIVRNSAGFLFVAVIPGYTLVTMFYRRFGLLLTLLERFVLSAPLSLAMSTIIGLTLNLIGVGTSPKIYTLITSLLILAGVVIALARPGQDMDATDSNWLGYWGLFGGLLLAAALIGLLAQIDFHFRRDAPTASLYLLDETGHVSDYPVTAQANTPLRIRLGVTNYSDQPQVFQINSSLGREILPILLPGQTWESQFEFSLPERGLNRVSWDLVADDKTIHRSVQLWVDVR